MRPPDPQTVLTIIGLAVGFFLIAIAVEKLFPKWRH